MTDLLALQALPELEALELGPHQFVIDEENCSLCTYTCSHTSPA